MSVDISSLIHDWESGICLRPLASTHGISPATVKKYLNNAGISTAKTSCFSKKVWDRIQNINKILDEYETRLTVRQIYYQMASRQLVPLNKKGYDSVVSACNKGRKKGYIDWNKIEDRTRQPQIEPMWQGVNHFKNTVLTAYKRDVWINQPSYFEIWLEKNALHGLVFPVARKYGVLLQTSVGYSSISALFEGSKRFKNGDTILYLGDHDATGVDIDRSIKDSFHDYLNLEINVERIGLLYEDIEKYNLISNPDKATDPRSKKYPYKKQAELDALSPNVLIKRVESAILSHLDMAAYHECKRIETEELNKIQSSFSCV